MNPIANPNTFCQIPSKSIYLEMLAEKTARNEAGFSDAPLNILDKLIHRVLNDLLFLFYPRYKEFYLERKVEAFTANGVPFPQYVRSPLQEGILFLRRFIASPENIGSIFPSSTKLIDAMTRKIEANTESPRRFLDIGAGTGSFSEGIIAKMQPQDHLDLVEYDPDLCRLLERKFQHLPNVQVHNISIFDFHPPYRYDVIVTGLPLNNFKADTVEQALKKYTDLTRPGGHFCYFEYLFLPAIGQIFRKVLFQTESLENCKRIMTEKRKVQQQLPTEIDYVYRNMPPARAIHCQAV